MPSVAAMLSSSDHRENKLLSDHGTRSSSRADAVAAVSRSPTSPRASSFPDEGAVVMQSCDRHSPFTTDPTSPWLNCRSTTTTSLDADDEADEQSPVNTSESAATPSPLAALALDYGHRQRTAIDSCQDTSQYVANGTGEVADVNPTTDTDQYVLERQQSTMPTDSAASGANGSAAVQTLVRRRSTKRSPSFSSALLKLGGSGTMPSSTAASFPGVPPLSAKACASSVQSTSAATCGPSGEVATATRAPAASVASTDSVFPSQTYSLRADSDAITNRSGSPSPPALTSLATATAKLLDSFPALHTSSVPLSPLGTELRLSSRTAVELQHFGCCVFFFPAPFVSWLFPLAGHVAISNAEGSRLFTFESSYYVREEKLVSVLDCVLREEVLEPRTTSLLREASPLGSRVELSQLPVTTTSRSPTSSQQLGALVMSDASASDAALTSPSDTSAGALLQCSATSSVFSSRCSARPLRRAGRQRSAAGASASGHAHTQCVRIWDLKPLLMESRGRRTRRTPSCFTTQGGKQAAVVLWERLQGLLQPSEISTSSAQGAATAGASTSTTSSLIRRTSNMKHRYTSGYHSDDADGIRSAPGMSSSSGEEEGGEYELLDAETAQFYNRNLNATIRLFRGSADGSINSPDVVLQHHSSFSFVGFVLEACGVGSQGKPNSTVSAPKPPVKDEASGGNAVTPPKPSGDTNGPATAPASDDAVPGESLSSEEEIHWGVMKLLFHVSVFGKWHRGKRRLWRVVHGGSITSATILWVAIIALAYHYFELLFL
ncbi:hypothetical protein, unknown function [Leishmania braziliensis MHOM/BR/75/M2904]|uniref:Transmembrane protein n=2 Tax=Leishmania braziliensis TaxID=5660 RepID=A4HKS9_LEIBR|nr:hypothetical protein, unknown function [Leishmania braziliensis MHOM/BR/75/M2904]KAI5687689.1 hypothetical protein MNV84_06749 [Leishmania braziliensis]CAJ2478808.1 unnamed protein product [Leishmania braziliensis]CAJ2479208.1 unnamed protein product [Leishmania braziliensis]CAM43107.2 hypothetical protein, unknown function [Leishmania braziliensis MHOM/BR/75/M2904]SYZ68813.1 Protein_of_uncharacterised_function_(DUF778) [Leishmania braziliensis MHOM/BR/75/M2904]